MHTTSTIAAGAAAVLTCLVFATPSYALECPLPKVAQSGALHMTPAELHALGTRLANDRDGNVTDEFAARVRTKSPDVAAGDLVDTLVAAYCGSLNASGEDDAAATSKLRRFASDVYQRLAKK